MEDAVEFTKELVRCPSITPEEGGALSWLQEKLQAHGFSCHRLLFSEDGTPDVDNLYARIGSTTPHLCFAGHTDVVPPGDTDAWTYPPFAAEINAGAMYGRGTADMKGGIACFLAAVLAYLRDNSASFSGSISFLITGDEEGPAINGTRKMLQWLDEKDEKIDHCIVGEPSSSNFIGEAIKVGRRGSLNGELIITGKQGHVAYQHLANSPMPGLIAVLGSYLEEPLDNGTEHFAPSNIEITGIDTGNDAPNVIPAKVRARFNIRFNDAHTSESLQAVLRQKTATALAGLGLAYELKFYLSGDSFVTPTGFLTDTMIKASSSITGKKPELSTSGGTSDARFIKDYCPVIEFGLLNSTIHQVDERVEAADLHTLSKIYRNFLEEYFGPR
jgi:succinyl-diaminopimelate desuccinylase